MWKGISEAWILKKHIDSVHNVQKDHKCDSCGKAFSSARYLKTHIGPYLLASDFASDD